MPFKRHISSDQHFSDKLSELLFLMETALIPKFFKAFQYMEIFRRAEVFMNACVEFTNQRSTGKNPSVETMKTLAKHPPVTGVPVLNVVFDLLKDVVFEYQSGVDELTKSRQSILEDKLNGVLGQLPKEMKLFDKRERETLSQRYTDLKKSFSEHKTAIETLKASQMVYIEELNRLNVMKACFKDIHGAHAQNAYLYENKPVLVAKSEEKVLVLELEVKNQVMKTEQALGDLKIAIEKELLIRNFRLKQNATRIRAMTEAKLRSAMTLGLYHLQEFAQAHNLPGSIIERLGYFDIDSAAVEMYKQMSTRYIYPTIERFAYRDAIPSYRLHTPSISVQDKQQIRFGRSESCTCLLDESEWGHHHEEMYVWTASSYRNTHHDSQLKFAKGEKIKQKLCSVDGSLAFGWKRPFPGGHKTYGFYNTSLTQLVP